MKTVDVRFFMLSFTLLVASCDEASDPAPAECLVQKVSYSDRGFSNEVNFFYDSNGRLIKVFGTTSTGFSGEGIYTYDSRGNPIKFEGTFNDPGGPLLYTYNDKNLLIRTERLTQSGELDSKYEYRYNTLDQRTLEERYYTNQNVIIKGRTLSFEYKTSTSKEPSLEKEFDQDGNLAVTREYEYDDKKTFSPLYSRFELPKHNITKETAKDASGNVLYVQTITYEYNDWGYPTKSVSDMQINGSPGVATITYTYECK